MKEKWPIMGLTILLFVSCKNGKELGTHTSPTITAQQFVSALNEVDDKPGDPSLLKKEDSLQEGYFVIYDAIDCHYRAVSLEELRQLTYEAYAPSFYGTAETYRYLERNDLSGLELGERVDYDEDLSDAYGFDIYTGRDSGYAYEEESATTDVNLLSAEMEEIQLINKASKVSYSYEVDFKTAVSLVKLGDEVQSLLNKKNELTKVDQEALKGSLMELGGVSFEDLIKAANSQKDKNEVLQRVAKRIGTKKENLENKILPELFGL